MTEARITRPRRLFVEAIGSKKNITFSELRKILVGKWENKIDLTTLYRVVETFCKQGLIHEVSHKWERIIFLASENFDPKKQSAEISICENCGHISTQYAPLTENVISKHTEIRKKSCSHCVL